MGQTSKRWERTRQVSEWPRGARTSKEFATKAGLTASTLL